MTAALVTEDREQVIRAGLVARGVIKLIRGYQYAFSWSRQSCRFWPTCSQYTLLAVREHGAGRGLALGARRIARCHPWNAGGHDPVPPKANIRSESPGGPGRGEG